MKIKEGDRFLCIKDVVMVDGEVAYKKGNVYLSELEGCITDDDWDIYHIWKDFEYFNEYFEKVLSKEDTDNIKTHIDKGCRYKIITDSASFQVGDLWIRVVVYECLDNLVVYVREYENFNKRFCSLIQSM